MEYRPRLTAVVTIALLCAFAAPVSAAADAYTKILGYKFGQSRVDLTAIEAEIRQADAAGRKAIEAKLLKAVASAKATFECKQFVCRMLRQIGTERCIPAMAALLLDEELSHMARFALQGMESPKVDTALRGALPKVKGKLRIGIVGTIGARRNRDAVADLAALITPEDPELAGAAIAALGRIGGADAAKALTGAKVPENLHLAAADAYLMCADSILAEGKAAEAAAYYRTFTGEDVPTIIRIAAVGGLVRAEGDKATPLVLGLMKGSDPVLQQVASKLLLEISGPQARKAFAAQFATMPANAQLVLLSSLTADDKGAAAAVTKAVDSKHATVRVAAIRALGLLGDAGHVEMLATLACKTDDAGKAAAIGLVQLRGDPIDEAMLALAAGKATPPIRAAAMTGLIGRGTTAAVPTLLTASTDKDAGVRKVAQKGLGALAGARDAAAIVALLVANTNSGERLALERSLVSAAGRSADASARVRPIIVALSKAGPEAKGNLMAALSRLGGAPALGAVSREARGKNVDIRKSAVRALAGWIDASSMPALLTAAKGDADPACKILALRGYVTQAARPSERPESETAALLGGAMKLAKRTEEKRAILAALMGAPCPKSQELAESYLTDPALKAEAGLAVGAIKQGIARKTYKASASDNGGAAKLAVDGNPETKWSTRRSMKSGVWFTLDMGVNRLVKGLTLDAGNGTDYPRGYVVYASPDGRKWGSPLADGNARGNPVKITLATPKRTRYLKIVQTGSARNRWSIGELTVESD